VFKKKNHLVGLDIGSRTIKAGEISQGKKGYRLENFGTIDIAPGLIEEGSIKDPEAVADSIRQLWKNQNIREQNVALSIGGYSVIVKPISMDMMSEEQVHESIHFEAEQYVPFDINDVNLDFHILGESLSNPNKIDVILVAAKKELVNDFVDLVQMARLNPCIIDHELFALQNIFELNYEPGEECAVLIDIGASKT
jgi:type IV pilus assembly protein PilM